MASSLYAPRLTRWRVAIGGVVRDCVEYEGKPLIVSREDTDTPRECLEIGGEVFLLMDETTVPVLNGGKAVRCVEYTGDDGATRLLTVTEEGKKKEVAEVDQRDGDEVLVVGCGGYYDAGSGTVQHVVDVHGERDVDYANLLNISA